jgi:hypothetical protein
MRKVELAVHADGDFITKIMPGKGRQSTGAPGVAGQALSAKRPEPADPECGMPGLGLR